MTRKSEWNICSHGEEEGKTPGNVLSVDAAKPFRHLQQFGGTFLTRWGIIYGNWFGLWDNYTKYSPARKKYFRPAPTVKTKKKN